MRRKDQERYQREYEELNGGFVEAPSGGFVDEGSVEYNRQLRLEAQRRAEDRQRRYQLYLKAQEQEIAPDGTIRVCLKIKNTGDREGDEVVQLYVSDDVSSMVRPERELAGFCRVHLQPGEEKTVCFDMKASQLAFLDEQMRWVVEEGTYTLMAGASCEDIRQSLKIMVTSTAQTDCRTRGFYAKAAVI